MGEKRASAEERELGFPAKKRSRDVRRAAEIVLVLAAMGEMRGGVGPTKEEREMMSEAREKLVRACEGFAPKDLFPGLAFGSVMKDMGLVRLEEGNIGKMSIGEKFLITKHKRFQTNSGAAIPISDKPSVATFPSSDVKTPSHSSGLPAGLLGRGSSAKAVPRVDRPPIRPETRLNGSSYSLPIKVKPAGDQSVQKSPAFVQQAQLSLSGKSRPDNKGITHPSAKREGPSTISQHVRGMNITQGSPLSNPHIKIGKIVQKFLQPQIPKHPIWTPPSRDYMNKSMPCQVCKVTINEVANALVCDACEKGYHIICVESHNQKGVPKGEWHCFKCLSLSNGKPLPPKYGRVTRNMTAKVHCNTAAVQPSPEVKVEKSSEKENQPKVIADGSADLQSPAGSMGNNQTNSETEINSPIGRETQEDDILSRRGDTNDKNPLENCPDDIIKCSGSGYTSDSAGLSVERAHEEKPSFELKGQPRSRKIRDGDVNCVIRKEDQEVVRYEPTDLSCDGVMSDERLSLPLDVSDNVDWIGDVVQVVDEKIYYQSCCVDGVVYKVHDYALLYSSSSSDQFTPSKLQAMWEDRKNRSKWVIANQCYFHDDLPKEVGRPFSPESNEVCESNHGITIVAGLIRGPCEVLPPGKHSEESQRRSRLSSRENDGLRPIFLCKWFFDETKSSFRDVSG